MTVPSDSASAHPEKQRGSDEPVPGRCGSKLRGSNPPRYCLLYPAPGATTCARFHGGSAPQVKAAAARRLAADKIRRDLDSVEIREIDNPLAELRRLTGEVVAWKDALASHVANLTHQMRYEDAKGGEQLRAEVALYERAMDRAGKFLEMWARLGIDAMLAEMQVKVTEGQVTAMTRGLDAYRLAAGVDDTAHQAGLSAMGKAMRG